MSPLPPSFDRIDPLDRAEAALRHLPGSDGPPDETRARTLAALQAAGWSPVPRLRGRSWQRPLKVAAALLIGVSALVYTAGLLRMPVPLAFADVARPLRDARSLAFRMTMQMPGQDRPVVTRVLFKEPGLVRMEEVGGKGGAISISDNMKKKILVLNPTQRQAIRIDVKKAGGRDAAPESTLQMLERLRKLAEKEGRPAGKKRIGEVEAPGFRVRDEGQEWTLWADPRTHLPLRAETRVQVGDKQVQLTLSDFELNPVLKDELFSLEVPEGYKLQTMEATVSASPEEDLAWLLEAYADKADGKFPERVDDTTAYTKKLWGDKTPRKDAVDPQFLRYVQRLGSAAIFLQKHSDGSGYRSKGVKLGDRDKVLFWYRPEKAGKYRALYGDLHWAEVSAEQLPPQRRP
jgi:outer membrane lipoprotein-sorting protein